MKSLLQEHYKQLMCHGLGIVDDNEVNSYLDYCSHQREYRIWGEKKKRNLSTVRMGFYLSGVVALTLSLFACPDKAFVDANLLRRR